jgi:predicted metal-binding membrane protein
MSFGRMIWGFPLKNAIAAGLRKSAAEASSVNRRFDNGPNVPFNDQFARDAAAAAMIHVRFTVWFYLWLLIILASMVPVVIECLVMLATAAHRLRARREALVS